MKRIIKYFKTIEEGYEAPIRRFIRRNFLNPYKCEYCDYVNWREVEVERHTDSVHFNPEDTTDKCFMDYVDGFLTCTYNHRSGEECLMNQKEI